MHVSVSNVPADLDSLRPTDTKSLQLPWTDCVVGLTKQPTSTSTGMAVWKLPAR
jgi:hypothetical protein